MLRPSYKEETPRVIGTFIRGYVRDAKAGGAVIGLSGGLDSTVILKLAVDSLGPENVLGVLMPEASTPFHSWIRSVKACTSSCNPAPGPPGTMFGGTLSSSEFVVTAVKINGRDGSASSPPTLTSDRISLSPLTF